MSYTGRTWNQLKVTRHVPGHRHATVKCLNPSCGVEFHLPVTRIGYAYQVCQSCGNYKPPTEVKDPAFERTAVAQQIAAERQEAERKAAEEAAGRNAEEARKQQLAAQAEQDAKAARRHLLEAERIRQQVESERASLARQKAEKEAAERREQALVAEREVAISKAIEGLTGAEVVECKHILLAWGQPLNDASWWSKARQTVEVRKANGRQFTPQI